MALAPLAQRQQRGQEVDALGGQPIFHLAPVILAALPGEHAIIDQPGKAIGQDIAGNPQFARKLLEMDQPVEGGPNDQQRPAFPHHLQGLRQAAFPEFAQRFARGVHPVSPNTIPPPYRQGAEKQCLFPKYIGLAGLLLPTYTN